MRKSLTVGKQKTNKRQSLAKVATKTVAKTAATRAVSDMLGGGTLQGKLAKTVVRHGINALAKYMR